MTKDVNYHPGIRNINKSEIEVRKQVGWLGIAITIVLWGFLAIFNIPNHWRLLVFLPATFSAFGFIQGRSSFCAVYALKGIYKIHNKIEVVENVEDCARDQQRATEIIVYSMLIGLTIAIIAYF